jgi:hypothetical protein
VQISHEREAMDEVVMDVAEDFLEVVYGEREAWIDLPAKVGKYWVSFYTEWPADNRISNRIDHALRDREDLYYSVAQFAQRGRRIEDVLPVAWLWADLDEVHPSEAGKFGYLPTIAIQSSPGRYQALWRLDRELKPGTAERLNRGLSYALDADKGGWDLTQVLRIPFTRNYKYPAAPVVELMWYKPELVYNPRHIWEEIKKRLPTETLEQMKPGQGRVDIPRTDIPAKARALLRVGAEEVVEGERSSRMWELICLLAEAGLTEQEIFDLVWQSAWNKSSDMRSGQSRVWREVRKGIRHVQRQVSLRVVAPQGDVDEEEDTDPEQGDIIADESAVEEIVERLPFVAYNSFMAMSMEAPRWLVKDIWTAQSHGIIGGEPKTSKTTLALALALAVASGKPFLGRYPVATQGPVLFVQEENAPWMMQDRLRKLAAYSGLISDRDARTRSARSSDLAARGKVVVQLDFPKDVPIRFLNNFGFDLDYEDHRDMLEAEVAAVRPALVVLDPLYLLLGGADLDKASSLRPFLKWLLHLRYAYGTAIAVVHHFRKASGAPGQHQGRAGQRVLGSTTLHGWSDSAIYASARDSLRTGWTSTRIETEFRSMAPQLPVDLSLTLGQPGDLRMEVEILKFNAVDQIYSNVPASGKVTIKELAGMLDLDFRKVTAMARGDERLRVYKNGAAANSALVVSRAAGNGDSGD